MKSVFEQWSQVAARSGVTGAEAAREVLRSAGVDGVTITRSEGFLSDHYNPATRTLALSPDNHDGDSSPRSASPPTRPAMPSSTRRATPRSGCARRSCP